MPFLDIPFYNRLKELNKEMNSDYERIIRIIHHVPQPYIYCIIFIMYYHLQRSHGQYAEK